MTAFHAELSGTRLSAFTCQLLPPPPISPTLSLVLSLFPPLSLFFFHTCLSSPLPPNTHTHVLCLVLHPRRHYDAPPPPPPPPSPTTTTTGSALRLPFRRFPPFLASSRGLPHLTWSRRELLFTFSLCRSPGSPDVQSSTAAAQFGDYVAMGAASFMRTSLFLRQ